MVPRSEDRVQRPHARRNRSTAPPASAGSGQAVRRGGELLVQPFEGKAGSNRTEFAGGVSVAGAVDGDTSASGLSNSSACTVRPQWMACVVRQCQLLIGETIVDRASDDPGAGVRHLVDGLPDAANRAEDLVLRAILADVAAHLDDFVHSPPRRGGCSFVTRRFRTTLQPAKQDFVEWAATYGAVATRGHRASNAQTA